MIPKECIGLIPKNETCKYVIWDFNLDFNPGLCHLANQDCEAKIQTVDNVMTLEAIGNYHTLIENGTRLHYN